MADPSSPSPAEADGAGLGMTKRGKNAGETLQRDGGRWRRRYKKDEASESLRSEDLSYISRRQGARLEGKAARYKGEEQASYS